MDIDVFSAPELPTVLRALRTALRAEGALDSRERLFLDTYTKIVNIDAPASDPPPVLMSFISMPRPSPMREICSHNRQVASEGTMGIRLISPRTSTRTPWTFPLTVMF